MNPSTVPIHIQEVIANSPIFQFDSVDLEIHNFNHLPSGWSDDVVRQTLLHLLLHHDCSRCVSGRNKSCVLCLIRVAFSRYPLQCFDRGLARDIIVGTTRTNGYPTQPSGIVSISNTSLHFNDPVTKEPLFGSVKS